MCLLGRKTVKRGKLLPLVFSTIFLCRRALRKFVAFIVYDPAAFPALPALRRITSFSYFIPLPLYGSAGRTFLILLATSPTKALSKPETVILFSAVLKLIPSG